ncbi:MAG: cytochrome c3 family protein, partial [Planctomycetota bacterium]
MKIRVSKAIAIVSIVVMGGSGAGGAIKGSPHDLSTRGRRDACSYCHTPHGALAKTPAWSHRLSTAVYKIYQSSSLEAKVGQPTGESKMCLSCHDGTVALTHTTKGGAGGAYIASGAANLGTDLSDDHPISFVYSDSLSAEDPQIKLASTLPQPLKLDSAHENEFGKFLVMSNQRSAMCTSCHSLAGWTGSVHESSAASVHASGDQYLRRSEHQTVADNGCRNCHRPHSAGGHERLLHFERSEDNCLNCHDGSVANTNLNLDLARRSRHNVRRYRGIHDLKESPAAAPEHVECVDCHNPHSTESAFARAPAVQGAMRHITGVTIT